MREKARGGEGFVFLPLPEKHGRRRGGEGSRIRPPPARIMAPHRPPCTTLRTQARAQPPRTPPTAPPADTAWAADWPDWCAARSTRPPTSTPRVTLIDRRYECVPYSDALADQHAAVAATLAAREKADRPTAGTLHLLQHPPVYTLGAGATLDHLRFDPAAPPAPLHRVERGGEATHHCPGQLVLYPILDLASLGLLPDLHWWLRGLEEVALRAVATVGAATVAPAFPPSSAPSVHAALADGGRLPGLTGAWVSGAKLAAVGVRASRWVTYHGVALNVAPDLNGFRHIVPCGIADRPVGSIASVALDAAGVEELPTELVGQDGSDSLATTPLVGATADALLAAFESVFGVMLVK